MVYINLINEVINMSIDLKKLQSIKQDKEDILKKLLSHYKESYNVNGEDALIINNLFNFISNNIIFKKRKEYDENALSDKLYNYTNKHFTSFSDIEDTLDIIKFLFNYNRNTTEIILDNPLKNIFGVEEVYRYNFKYNPDYEYDENNDINQYNKYSIEIDFEKEEHTDVLKLEYSFTEKDIIGGILKEESSIYTRDISSNKKLKTGIYSLKQNNNNNNVVEIELIKSTDNYFSYKKEHIFRNLVRNIHNEIEQLYNNLKYNEHKYIYLMYSLLFLLIHESLYLIFVLKFVYHE